MLIFFLVSLLASVVGAICGIGHAYATTSGMTGFDSV